MSLKGNLSTLPVADLLQTLAQGGKSGTLVVRQGELERKIFFRNGKILASASSDPKEHLGAFLVETGLVDQASVDHAMRLQRETEIQLGRVLVTMGVVDEVALHHVIQRKAERTIGSLLTSSEGRFEFLEDELPSAPMVPASLNVVAAILAGSRKNDERRQALSVLSEPPPSDIAPAGQAEPIVLAPVAPPVTRGSQDAASPVPLQTTALAPRRRPMAAAPARPGVPALYRRAGILGGALLAIAAGLMAAYYPREANRDTAAAGAPLRFEAGRRPAAPPPLPAESLTGESPLAEGPAVGPVAAATEREQVVEATQREQVLEQIQQLVDSRAVEIEASVRELYEAELAGLRQQLERVQRTVAEDQDPLAQAAPTKPVADLRSGLANRPDPRPDASSAPARALGPASAGAGPTAGDAVAASAEPEASQEPTASLASGRLARETAEPAPGPAGGAADSVASEPQDPVVVRPRILRRPEPRYPRAARVTKSEGTVVVRVLVGPDGDILDIEQVSSDLGFGFDVTALKAARQSKWSPGTRDGVPTAMWAELRFDFRL